MRYKCIWPGCHEVWGEAEPGVTGYSHGFCSRHARQALASTFRKQQSKEGNPDCYLRCEGYCHRHWCTYYPICPNENPGPEHLEELMARLAARSHSGFPNGV